MELKTQRLTLVPLGREHLDTTYAYSSDVENTRLMKFLPVDSREETLEFLLDCERQWASPDPDYCEFAVMLEGVHIGAVGIYREGEGLWEFGWIFDRRYHGCGYATEAAGAVLAEWAGRPDVRRFIAHCDSENTASARVMEKLGMRFADSWGGRYNRSSPEERTELLYELINIK